MRRIGVLCGALLVLLVIDYFAYPYGRELSGKSWNRGENGVRGVALFADYTMDDGKWRWYDRA